jgi:hypothetical protein
VPTAKPAKPVATPTPGTTAKPATKADPKKAVGDVPVRGQYDGDGKAELAVWHAGSWQIRGVSGLVSYPVGTIGDVPATLG